MSVDFLSHARLRNSDVNKTHLCRTRTMLVVFGFIVRVYVFDMKKIIFKKMHLLHLCTYCNHSITSHEGRGISNIVYPYDPYITIRQSKAHILQRVSFALRWQLSQTYTYLYTYIHTYIHSYIHTYIHTHTHTHMYSLIHQL